MKKEVDLIINTFFSPSEKRETKFGAYFTNSLEGGDATGYAVATIERDDLEVRSPVTPGLLWCYAVATIERDDLEVRWTSQDMRISRAAKLAEHFGRRLRHRYYEISDSDLLVWMVNHPALRLHWHSDLEKTRPENWLTSNDRYYFCKTPFGTVNQTITRDGITISYLGETQTGLGPQASREFIIEKMRQALVSKAAA